MTINKIVTKGMGSNQSVGLVLMGFTVEIARILRGGRSVARDLYSNLYEEFLIAAKLIEINGKEFFSPIFNRSKYVIDESKNITVKASRKDIKKKDDTSITVTAKITKTKRGSDGDY